MNKCICDVCKRNEANRGYRVQERRIHKFPIPNGPAAGSWGLWEEIDICDHCAEKLIDAAIRKAAEE